MPRRRMRIPRTPKVKAPKPMKIPRPKTKDLRMLYRGLLTVSEGQRISTLSYALQWYDSALPYLIQRKQLSVDARQKLEKAVLCRKRGIDNTNVHEKEVSFMMALRMYEKACVAIKPPLLDDFYKKLDGLKDKLQQMQQKLEQKYGEIFALLQKAVGNRFKFEVADAVKPVQWNPELTTLSYNREAAKQLSEQFKEQGFLPVFFEQLDYLVRHACLEQDPDPSKKGGWLYDPAKHVDILNDLLKEFVQFAKSPEAPKRLVRDGVPKPILTPGQRPQFAPRGPRPGIRGPKVAGLYTQGSAAAIVYERLADGNVWSLTELLAGVNFSHPIWLVKRMFRLGEKTGCWKVNLTKTTAQLAFPQAQAAAAVQP